MASLSAYCIQGKFRPCFIFALWPEGKFKTGLIELCIKDIVKKLDSWANSRRGKSISDLYRAKIRLYKFKAVYIISFWHAADY